MILGKGRPSRVATGPVKRTRPTDVTPTTCRRAGFGPLMLGENSMPARPVSLPISLTDCPITHAALWWGSAATKLKDTLQDLAKMDRAGRERTLQGWVKAGQSCAILNCLSQFEITTARLVGFAARRWPSLDMASLTDLVHIFSEAFSFDALFSTLSPGSIKRMGHCYFRASSACLALIEAARDEAETAGQVDTAPSSDFRTEAPIVAPTVSQPATKTRPRRLRNRGDATELLVAALDSLIEKREWGKTHEEICNRATISRSRFYELIKSNRSIERRMSDYKRESNRYTPVKRDDL
jgi:hypothetical protein